MTAFQFDGSTAEGATVVHDHDNAGLGVYPLDTDTSDDNVTGNTSDGALETPMLSFNLPVTLSGMTFRDSGHNSLTSDTYPFNGGSAVFGTDPSPVSGTEFTFAHGGEDPNQFYLPALEASVTAPDGGMIAILLGLSLLGLGTFSRRAKRQAGPDPPRTDRAVKNRARAGATPLSSIFSPGLRGMGEQKWLRVDSPRHHSTIPAGRAR